MSDQIDTKNTNWHLMICKLAKKHNLGFLHNPGGGQFINPDKGVNIQISTYDNEKDYRKLLAGLQKLGLEPAAESSNA